MLLLDLYLDNVFAETTNIWDLEKVSPEFNEHITQPVTIMSFGKHACGLVNMCKVDYGMLVTTCSSYVKKEVPTKVTS